MPDIPQREGCNSRQGSWGGQLPAITDFPNNADLSTMVAEKWNSCLVLVLVLVLIVVLVLFKTITFLFSYLMVAFLLPP